MELKSGDVVRLKIGSRKMLVNHFGADRGNVWVVFDSLLGISMILIREECLELVENQIIPVVNA